MVTQRFAGLSEARGGITCRDQRAVCFASRDPSRPRLPLDQTRSTSQTARSSRATSVRLDRMSDSFRLKLASSLRLRGFTHFVPLASPPLARRPLQTEALLSKQ